VSKNSHPSVILALKSAKMCRKRFANLEKWKAGEGGEEILKEFLREIGEKSFFS
jgi:hypothetical protein